MSTQYHLYPNNQAFGPYAYQPEWFPAVNGLATLLYKLEVISGPQYYYTINYALQRKVWP